MSQNFNNMFTYESITYGDGKNINVSYNDCIMLRDLQDMKKGMKVAVIALSYDLYGWSKHEGSEYTDADLYAMAVIDNSSC
jgi:hypothetical protein